MVIMVVYSGYNGGYSGSQWWWLLVILAIRGGWTGD